MALGQALKVETEDSAGASTVAFTGLWVREIIVDNLGQKCSASFAICGAVGVVEVLVDGILADAFVGDIECSKMGVVVGDEVGCLLSLPIAGVGIERDECGDELVGRRVR